MIQVAALHNISSYVDMKTYECFYFYSETVNHWVIVFYLFYSMLMFSFVFRDSLKFGTQNWVMGVIRNHVKYYAAALFYWPTLLLKKVVISILVQQSVKYYDMASIYPLYAFMAVEIGWLAYIRALKPLKNEYANRVSIINSLCILLLC